MSAYRALLVYEELLRKFQSELASDGMDPTSALEAGFSYLIAKLNLQSLSLFWWDKTRSTLVMEYEYREEIFMKGEDELLVNDQSRLWPLIQNKMPVVVSEKNPWVAYIPMWEEDRFCGAIRIQRKRILPRGKVLGPLPRFQSKTAQGNGYPLMEDISDILSVKLQQITREINQRKQTQYLKAASDVAAAVVETVRLKDMLEAVTKSIVKNLGFDRIRFYLVDPSRSELKGVLGLQIPDRLINLEEEKYPLKPNLNSLVDAVLEGKNEFKFVSAGGKVVYLPLVVGGQVIGCLAVDNLLSQVVIDDQQMATLKSLVGQIGMAVLNARLFEDIEQQAITDGLTKLYVYRYFQQRLKEEIDRADRYNYSLALVMMDVDNFKHFNDTYGHALGDQVLEFLAGSIRANIRRIDLAARYGGDEFILLLPETTEQEAWLMGTRLLNAIKDSKIKTNSGEKISVNVTLGVSLYGNDAKKRPRPHGSRRSGPLLGQTKQQRRYLLLSEHR